ncbi:hypothetical protein J6590_025937 [Homalodisca vitripennis]|nr:hypothetical protein J6590_025937 [Homalodisca vitripennis]
MTQLWLIGCGKPSPRQHRFYLPEVRVHRYGMRTEMAWGRTDWQSYKKELLHTQLLQAKETLCKQYYVRITF